MGCNSLEHVTVPASVREVGINAFMECQGLVGVEFREGIEEFVSVD